MRVPELLAPAGSREALTAAVQNGADAVYLGGASFNARRSAPNFSAAELERAITYAHIRGVKVYVTVNTLVAEEEMEEALRFLRFVYESGADAAIIQDIGLLRLARGALPELQLHASTQMTVHNAEGAAFLGEAGISRVILARELTLNEIKVIKETTALEIEVFVHGALCVCYSGQCLLSSMVGGRSGNRGVCAQPCRLPYTLVDEKGAVPESEAAGEYLLSTRDLNYARHIPALAAAGIDALKIEGRMKRPEYVATVVRIYRCLLERLAAGNFFVAPEESAALAQIFNRGFSTGYLFGRPGRSLMNMQRPSNRGVPLGRVIAYDRSGRLAEIKLTLPLRLGDTVEFWVSEGGRVVTRVERLLVEGREVLHASPPAVAEVAAVGGIRPGDRVFKTEDAALVHDARTSFSGAERKEIPLRFRVTLSEDQPCMVRVEDREGNCGEGFTHTPAVRAGNQPLTRETLKAQLGRLGGTPFRLAELDGPIAEGLFIPKSELNAARRAAVNQLERKRSRVPEKLPDAVFAKRVRGLFLTAVHGVSKPFLSVACADLAGVSAALEAGADRIYYGGEFREGGPDQEDLAEAAARVSSKNRELYFLTPRITKDNELKVLVDGLRTAGGGGAGVVAGNLGLVRALGRETGFIIWADYYLNVFNTQAAAFLQDHRVKGAALSPELNLYRVAAAASRSPLPVEVVAHGLLPLMALEYCVVGGIMEDQTESERGCAVKCRGKSYALKDRMGALFPVYTGTDCRAYIFNSRELVMLAHLPALVSTGVAGLRIEARTRDAAYVFRVTSAYRKGLDAVVTGAALDFTGLEEELTGKENITRGHYFRPARRQADLEPPSSG
jgi:putative protease